MANDLGPLASALKASAEQVFVREERHFFDAAVRHVRVALALLRDSELVADADFHCLIAAECTLKHLFCLVRFTAGWRANAREHEQFGEIGKARTFNHNVKELGAFLLASPELQGYAPLEDLMPLLSGGEAWNDDRYQPIAANAERGAKVGDRIMLVQQMLKEAREARDGR